MTHAAALPLVLTVRAADRDLGGLPGSIAREDAAVRELGDALRRERPLLLAAARAITLNDAEADDVVQATFEIAIRHRTSLRDPAALRAWLLTIQAREAFRLMRRLRRFVRLGPDTAHPTTAGPTPDAAAVRDALGTLSPRVRAAVVLHHMAGLPVADVARALGVSPNTVKTQLRTGLAYLREELRDE